MVFWQIDHIAIGGLGELTAHTGPEELRSGVENRLVDEVRALFGASRHIDCGTRGLHMAGGRW